MLGKKNLGHVQRVGGESIARSILQGRGSNLWVTEFYVVKMKGGEVESYLVENLGF